MKNVMTIFLAAVVLGLCGSVQATTYYVESGESIQAAIDLAEYGDTVEVAAGTYEENITLKDGVAVIGAGGPSDTIIDGGAVGSVVIASECGPDTILKGFTIRNGGVGVNNYNSSTTVIGCEFIGNSSGVRNSGSLGAGSNLTVTNCTFVGNGDPSISMGGGIENFYHGNSTVTDCTFINNTAYRGGGMYNEISSESIVTNCTFIGNKAWEGGGMCNHSTSPTVTGCTFLGNKAGHGGGMYNRGVNGDFSDPIVTNCTFSGNSAYYQGGGMSNYFGNPAITNCIIWGNTAAENGDEIYNESPSVPIISYTNIAGCGGDWTGIDPWGKDAGNNMDEDPLFVSPGYWDTNGMPEDPADDIWVNGDYHLFPDSPCVDAGDNDAVPADVTTDLDGNPRIVNEVVDMGAYEYCDYEPDIDVDPLTWDFGDVELGESSSIILTISSTGNDDLIISTLDFATQSTEFEIESPPLLPLEIAPEGSVEIKVVFTPSAELSYSADLEIESNDPDESPVIVNLSGRGVPAEIPPSQQILDILQFIEDSELNGSLVGTGTQPDKKIDVLLNMISSAGDLIEPDCEKAYQQLSVILRKCDGLDTPPDFVEDGDDSEATEKLADMIITLMENLGCE